MASFLIPGLPDDIAERCLALIPLRYHHKLSKVCKTWKQLFSSPTLINLQETLNIPAEAFLFVIDVSENAEHHPSTVDMLAINISRGRPAGRLSFTNPDIRYYRESIFLAGRACVGHRSKIFVLGGYSIGHVSDRLHIFDVMSNTWTIGPAMSIPRAEFGYGIIGHRLFVAGGFFSTEDSQDPADFFTRTAEVYDIFSNTWCRIAEMPTGMKCDFSWTHKGRLYFKGCVYDDRLHEQISNVISYSPETDSWNEEPVMCELLSGLSPVSLTKMISVGKTEVLYMADVKQPFVQPSLVEISKLNSPAQKWEPVMQTVDYASHFFFDCESEPSIYGLHDKVVVCLHHEHEILDDQCLFENINEMVEVHSSMEVVKMHIPCPGITEKTILFL